MKKIKDKFSLGGMVFVTILLIIGILIMFFVREIPIYIFGGFFVFVGLYCWYGYISNVLIRPKERILYLKDKDNNNYIFIDDRGRKYRYCSKKRYDINKYYLVLKSKDYVVDIIDESLEKFEIVEKSDSYWGSCYLPIGNFEGIFLLPIIYLIVVFSLSLILFHTTIDLGSIIMFVVAFYLIIYDFIYKYKKKKSKNGEVDDSSLKKTFHLLINGIKILTILFICFILLFLFFLVDGLIGKLFLSFFVLCAICLLFRTIYFIKGNKRLANIFDKLFTAIFLIYWFWIIISGICVSIINKEYSMILILILFIIVGIYVGYSSFFKKRR